MGMIVDHIDRNVFNNQKVNLRVVTPQQSSCNTGPKAGEYKGVVKRGQYNRWRARIRIPNGGTKGTIYLGDFKTPEEAARVYDKKAFELNGKYAYLNFPEEWPK